MLEPSVYVRVEPRKAAGEFSVLCFDLYVQLELLDIEHNYPSGLPYVVLVCFCTRSGNSAQQPFVVTQGLRGREGVIARCALTRSPGSQGYGRLANLRAN